MPCACASRTNALERVGPAIAELDGEQVGRVVAPRDVTRELERGHDLDRRDAQPLADSAAAGEHRRRCPAGRPTARTSRRASRRSPGRSRSAWKGVVTPVEGRRVVHDPVSDRARDMPRIRVDPRQVAVGRADREPVLRARLDAGHVDRPGPARAVAIAPERRAIAGPIGSNVPVTKTASACGAQTRNVVPRRWGSAPIPGRVAGALSCMSRR